MQDLTGVLCRSFLCWKGVRKRLETPGMLHYLSECCLVDECGKFGTQGTKPLLLRLINVGLSTCELSQGFQSERNE